MQESLLRAWRMRGQCRTPEAPEGWITAIARREGLRAAARRTPDPVGELPAARHAAPDDAERALDRLQVEDALAVLAPHDRRLVRMRYVEDCDYAEIARVMGMNETTVRVRLHRARARLRDVI